MRKIKFILFAFIFAMHLQQSIAQVNPATNIIAVDVSTSPQNSAYTYDSCFKAGTDAGMTEIGLFLNWSTIEPTAGTYDFSIPDIANLYYPLHGMTVNLNINPVSTNNLEVPADLASSAFDNPVFISRFKAVLDSIKIHMPAVTFGALIIGSESDVYFGLNISLWSQYTSFYDSALTYAKTIWPGMHVATELTFNGLTNFDTLCQTLNTNSDYIGVSYYPITSTFTVQPVSQVNTDFATITSLYTTKPICFYQCGYPSSPSCNSSETLQKDFITQTFTSWDTYAGNIKSIDFTWLHDLDTATVNYYCSYYGITDTSFAEFLRTLGLRTWNNNGTNKPAMNELICQANLRGFNSLSTYCTAGIAEIENVDAITVFPNPASTTVFIQAPGVHGIEIYSSTGQCLIHSCATKCIDISFLPSGLYHLRITTNAGSLTKRIVKQ
jgi:hypothetical protein